MTRRTWLTIWSMPDKAEKAALRRRLGALPVPPAAASEAICRQLLALPEFLSADSVLAFYPMAEEPDIRPVLEAALAAGKTLSLPRCLPGHRLAPAVVFDLSQLEPGVWNIPAPPETAPAPEHIALALIPGVAFDAAGMRLGHGAGYYDRFLSGFSGATVGVCFSQRLLPSVPAEPHDQPVRLVVTDGGLFRNEVYPWQTETNGN